MGKKKHREKDNILFEILQKCTGTLFMKFEKCLEFVINNPVKVTKKLS